MRLARLAAIARLAAAVLLIVPANTSPASGPRWVAGWGGQMNWGTHQQVNPMITWYTQQPMYFTDPGDLSPSVNHAAADALVAAAINVWNVPTSFMVPTYGGLLSEHVDSTNAYLGPDGLVFPADVDSSNWQAKQIAVIYDSDGSVTEMLLGAGASDPAECRLNAVTGTVDLMVWHSIEHAMVVLNGRCTGSAPEKQLQMQYQLMRAFGRIFGLAWSQTNDNVFTGSPVPSFGQAMNWPIMHPIDLRCGAYSYQCFPQPFTLRPDDVASISMLYGNGAGYAPDGKSPYLAHASELSGEMTFPSGQGMAGVNLVVRRTQFGWNTPEDFLVVSGVTGYQFRTVSSNPVTGGGNDSSVSGGSIDSSLEGYYDLAMIPQRDGEEHDLMQVTTEPINPLYTGTYAIGPDGASVIAPSGSATTQATPYWGTDFGRMALPIAVGDAAPVCNSTLDGSEAAPAAINPSGWWSGLICAYGHTAWSGMKMAGGRSLTVEVTALDEAGAPTTSKAMPVVGIWDATSAAGTGPANQTGIAATTGSFNSMTLGMTNLGLSSAQPLGLRMVIADQRGDGRPDFAYKARVLYADAIAPANISASGAVVTITGMGFRQGNAVFVNGVPAKVTSWSATQIVALAPPGIAAHALGTVAVDVMVKDLSTGGTTLMTGALLYGQPAAANVMKLLSAPSGNVFVGDAASTAFAVQMFTGDGITPLAGETVTFTAVPGVIFGACGTSICALLTDAQGIASTTVAPQVAGVITLEAADGAVLSTASFTALANLFAVGVAQTAAYVAEAATVPWSVGADATKNGVPVAGQTVRWTATATGTAEVQLRSANSITDATGWAQMPVVLGPFSGGQQATIDACAWTTACATVQVTGVAASDLRPVPVSGATQNLTAADTLGPVTLDVTDLAGDAVMGANVQVFQTVSAWQMACPPRGRCPAAPVLQSSQATATSDAAGQVILNPLQIKAAAGTTQIAVSVGTGGFLSLTLVRTP